MSVSLIGIVCVQIFWILNAVKIREERFSRDVNEALNELVGKIETHETSGMIVNSFGPFNIKSDDQGFSDSLDVPELFDRLEIPVPAKRIYFRFGGDVVSDEEFGESPEHRKIVGDKAKKTIKHNNAVTTSMTINADSLKDFCITLANDQPKINIKAIKFTEVIQKMLLEFERKKIPLATRLEKMDFQKLLNSSLKNHDIRLPYEYKVSSGSKHEKAITTEGFDNNVKKNLYSINLFPNDIVEKSDALKIYFPGKDAFIYRSLVFMISGSVIFTLIILITFIITLFTILRQKRISDIKNDFINNMTHEFKTPIATISLASDSISNPLVQENKEMIQYFSRVIKDEAIRMNTKVERVLQLSLLDKKDVHFVKTRVDAHEIINKAIEKIMLQVDQKKGRVVTDFQAEKYNIDADSDHFLSVMLNLLDNAIKYSPDAPDITVSTCNSGNAICIAVTDKGIGIEKHDCKKIFDRFFRVHTGDVHNVKGFGLGLSYVKEIIASFGGKVSVSSQKGAGSTFTVYLPVMS